MTIGAYAVDAAVPAGEDIARACFALAVDGLLKSGKVGYVDVVAALLAIAANTIALVRTEPAETVIAGALAEMEANLRPAMLCPDIERVRAAIEARSVTH